MNVTLIAQNEGIALIQWSENGELFRTRVPVTSLTRKGDLFEHPNPAAGVPVELVFDAAEFTLDLTALGRMMKEAGIFSVTDYRTQREAVRHVIAAFLNLSYFGLLAKITE